MIRLGVHERLLRSGVRGLHVLQIVLASVGLAAWGPAQVTLQPDFELPGGANYPTFGWSLDADADALIVGAPGAGNGKALVYRISTNTLIRELSVPESVAGDEFGHAVAVSGSFALVGAPGRNGGAGKVYLFDLANGQLVGGFVPGDVVPGDRFGEAVDLDASLGKLLVGAPGQADGAAYLVGLTGLLPQAKLVGMPNASSAGFGEAVALDAGKAIVTEALAGRVYFFSDVGLPLSFTSECFPWLLPNTESAIDASGGRVAVGCADFTEGQLQLEGGLCVLNGGGSPYLQVSGPSSDTRLGTDVALTESLVLAGAPGGPAGGTVLVYSLAGGQAPIAELLSGEAGSGQAFGWSLSTSAQLCFVGAPGAGRVLGYDLSGVGPEGGAGSPFCSGDGSAAACFCGASSLAGSGCPNSVGAAGASLLGSGNPSLSQGTFQLSASGLPPGRPSLMLRANGQLNGGLGTPVGDGLLCVTGASNRSQVQFADPGGGTTFSDFNGGSLGLSAGSALNYQLWYRDPANACSGAGFNFSNGWEVNWVP